jgi:hypothetical protein
MSDMRRRWEEVMTNSKAIYSAFMSAEQCARELLTADTLKRYGRDSDCQHFIRSADRELHKLALALGYHLTPASQPVTIEHEPVGGLTR